MEKKFEISAVNIILAKIDKIRLQKGLSVFKLTELAGLSANTIYNWYNKNAVPKITALQSICEVLGITLSELFANDEAEAITVHQQLLVVEFARLSENQQRLVLELIHELYRKE